MVADTLKFLLLLVWIVSSWAIFFWLLFREPYGRASNNPSTCIDVDQEFESFSATVLFLLEATLDGTGYYNCLVASSSTYLASGFMYLYVLTSTIMLINMLIAMMAESFGRVRANELEYFLFLKARQVVAWRTYAPVPPPLNLLRLPYEILWVPYSLLQMKFPHRLPRISTRDPPVGDLSFNLPQYWKDGYSIEGLAREAVKHVQEDEGAQAGEIARIVCDELRGEIKAEIRAECEQLAVRMETQMAEFREAVVQSVAENMAGEMVDVRSQLHRALRRRSQTQSTSCQSCATTSAPDAIAAVQSAASVSSTGTSSSSFSACYEMEVTHETPQVVASFEDLGRV